MGGVGPPPAPRVLDPVGLLLELFAGEYLGTFRSFITRNFGTPMGTNVYWCFLRDCVPVWLQDNQCQYQLRLGTKRTSLCARAFWAPSLPWWQELIRSPHQVRVCCVLSLHASRHRKSCGRLLNKGPDFSMCKSHVAFSHKRLKKKPLYCNVSRW